MRRSCAIRAAAFAVALAVFLTLAHAYGSTRIAHARYWVLHDDFMISERYARNLVSGRGLVFNPGERVEGFSDPLMVLGVCLPLEWMRVEPRKLGLYVWIVNGVVSSLIALSLFFGGARARPRAAAAIAALLYLTLPHHAFFARAGLEVYFQALCLMVTLLRLQDGGPGFYAAFATFPLVHAIDLPLWIGAGALRLRSQHHRWRAEARALALASVPIAAYLAFRVCYYGEIAPNTYYAKASGVLALRRGGEYLIRGAGWIAPVLVIATAALWKTRRRAPAAWPALAVFLPYHGYVAILGGDNFDWYRFVFILIPALMALTLRAADVFSSTAWAALGIAAAGLQLALNIFGYRHTDARTRALLGWDRSRIAMGYAIRTNTTPDQTVALFGIGNASYFGERPVIDMLGKTDAHIARTRPKKQRWVGHQKDDPEYVMSRRPDFVEMSFSPQVFEDVEQIVRERPGRWGYFADLALDPTFRRDYHPVYSNAGYLPMYARNDLAPRRWIVLPEWLDR